MWIGAPSGEDQVGLLQGHQSQTRLRVHPVRLPRLYVPAAAGEVERRAVRGILSSGGWPKGTEGDPSDDRGMDVATPERQGARRSGADVQPVYPRLDQLLRPLLQVGVVSDVAPDRVGRDTITMATTHAIRRQPMLVGYARTSTIEQAAGLATQRRDLKAAGCEKFSPSRCPPLPP